MLPRGNHFVQLTDLSRSRWVHFIGYGLAVVGVFAYGLAVDERFGFGHDEACYVGLAQALAEGEGYRVAGHDHAQYPPGLPLLLLPIALFRGDVGWAMQFVVACLGLVACWLATKLPVVHRLGGFVGLACLFSAPFHFAVTSSTMAESAYAVFATGFLVWATRAPSIANRFDPWVGSFLLVATVMTRTIGISQIAAALAVFAGGIFASSMVSRGDRDLALRLRLPLAVASLALFCWIVYGATRDELPYAGAAVPGYFEQFLLIDPHAPDLGRARVGDLVGRYAAGAVDELAHAAEILTNVPWVAPTWWNFLSVGTAVLLVLGALAVWRREHRLPVLAFGFYLSILFLWPYDEGSRFLLPIEGSIFWFAIEGCVALPTMCARVGARRVACAALAVALLCAVGAGSAPRSLQALSSVFAWATVGAFAITIALGSRKLVDFVRRGAAVCVVAWALGFVALGGRALIREAYARSLGVPAPIARDELVEVAEWIVANVAAEDTVLATDAVALCHATGHRVERLPVSADPRLLRRAIALSGATHRVVLDPVEFAYYEPTESERLRILRECEDLELGLEAELGGGAIWSVKTR